MDTVKKFGSVLFVIFLLSLVVYGLSAPQAEAEDDTVKTTAIESVQALCADKKVELEGLTFLEATTENVTLYKYLQSDEGCYYWFYDSVLKGSLVKK